jgi:hypothetical protein
MLMYANENRGLLIPLGPLEDGQGNAVTPLCPWQDGQQHTVTVPTTPPQTYITYQTMGTEVYPWMRWPAALFGRPYNTAPNPIPAGQPVPEPPGDPMGFFSAAWTPPIMVCPSDPQPGASHSYLFNQHLVSDQHQVLTYTRRAPAGQSDTQVVVLGEKRSSVDDYYMEAGDFPISGTAYTPIKVELYRHGAKLGSNYLYKDMHAVAQPPSALSTEVDPWDITPTAAETTGTSGT